MGQIIIQKVCEILENIMEAEESKQFWVNEFETPPSMVKALNFTFEEEIEYNDTISSYCLSHHGYIMAVGFNTGEIFACDSRNFCNKHEYTTHKGDVSSISFSRDTLHIASSDKTGFFQVHQVVTGQLEMSFSFDSPIKTILYHPIFVDTLLLLLDNGNLFLINTALQKITEFSNKYSCIVWSTVPNQFFAAQDHTIAVCDINEKRTEILSESKHCSISQKNKSIASIALSHNGLLLNVIDSKGSGIIFLTEGLYPFQVISDPVNRPKFAYATFSRYDQELFLVTNNLSSKTFVAYDTVSFKEIHSFRGLKETVRGICSHPTRPLIFLRFKHEIYSWYYEDMEPLYNSVPEKGLMVRNEVFSERESEFDSSDCEEDEDFGDGPLILQRREKDGVLNIFPDDENYPDQIYFLPYKH